MSVSAISGASTASTCFAAPQPDPAFTPLLDAIGRSHATHHQGNGTSATAAKPAPHTLASDSRAWFGDLFGALGASTPSDTAATEALAAYRSHG
jgi:hypothetical protein